MAKISDDMSTDGFETPQSSDESESSAPSSVELPRRLRKYDKLKPALATPDEAAATMANLKRRRTRIRKQPLRVCRRVRKTKADSDSNDELTEKKNRRKLKRLQEYSIPKEKYKRAIELLNAGVAVFRPIEQFKIYNLVHLHRSTRTLISPVRLTQQIQLCLENRDFRTAVGLMRYIFTNESYQTLANVQRIILGLLAMDPIARENNYMRMFLEGNHIIAENFQHEFLLKVSKIPIRLEKGCSYDTTSRYSKTDQKVASEPVAGPQRKRGLKITGLYNGVKKKAVGESEEQAPRQSRKRFKKFES